VLLSLHVRRAMPSCKFAMNAVKSWEGRSKATWKREFKLPRREVHLWIRTSRLSIKNSLSRFASCPRRRRSSSPFRLLRRVLYSPFAFFVVFFTLLQAPPRRSLILQLTDTRVFEPQRRARPSAPLRTGTKLRT